MKKRRLLSLMLLVCFILGVSGSLTSCKDYDDDAGWNDRVANNESLIKALQEQVANLQAAQQQCRTQCDKNNAAISVINDTINNIRGRVSSNSSRITALENEKVKIYEKISNLEKADSLLNIAITQTNGRIDDAEARISKLEEGYRMNTQAINNLRDSLAECMLNCNKTALKVEGLVTTINNLNGKVDSLNNAINTRLDGQDAKIANLVSTVDSLDRNIIQPLNNTVNILSGQVEELYRKAYRDSLSAHVADSIARHADSLALKNYQSIVETNYRIDTVNNTIQLMNGQIVSLDSSVTALNTALGTVGDLAKANEQAIKTLQAEFDSLQKLVNSIWNAFKLQVTSIAVNGTYNPIFGYYAVPSGDIRSTVLGTYYGKPESFQFPTAISSYYANANQTLTNKDLEVTGMSSQSFGGQTIVSEDGAEGNAGKLWLTLNPTEVDFTGKNFSLVNSRGVGSALSLSSVKPSDELLQFGYTRAASTGFYEAQGTINANDVDELKPNVNLNDMKDELRTIYHNWKNRATNGGFNVNLSQLAGVIYENVNNVLPALALKTSWATTDTAGIQNTHSVLSQYCVGAAAVHPLSFGFLQGRTYTPLPVYTAYEDINVNVDTITVNTVQSTGNVRVTVHFKDHNGNDSTATYTVDGINELIDSYNDALVGIQSQVNNQIHDIDSQLDQLSNLSNLFKTYDRWANRVNGWFSRDGNNDINRSLQPVIFYGLGNEMRKLGNTKYATVALPSGSSLLATSYTFELLAPAYKKWVAVTNVWKNSDDAVRGVRSAQDGNADALSALRQANNGTNMNQVVFGTERSFTLGTLKSDYVYEISYAAVDYNGKNVVRKFYVRGK